MVESKKRLHLVSLGCVKNRVDTEVMLGVAARAGYCHVTSPDEADVIVINTCGFIDDAKRESIDVILEMAAHKVAGTCQKLVVTGCLAQRYPAELSEQFPEVDHFLGSSDALALEGVLTGAAQRLLVGSPADWVIRATDPRVVTTGRATAYVKIAEGCNRRCSFCVIPKLRGRQRSRPVQDVLAEVEQLASSGVLELNLVSQDTVAYGRDLEIQSDDEARAGHARLAGLVARVADVPGVRWVRLLYLYPEALSDELLDVLAHHPRVLPYVDMPLQHVTDSMLRRMRRGHGGARIKNLVERLRRKIPALVMRTAFIVGHPGETDQDFEELCDFVRWARIDRLAAFCYSDEEDTASHDQDGKVKPSVIRARYRKLMGIQKKISLEKQRALVGASMDVLIEGPSDDHAWVLAGRHAGQAPEIDGQVFLSGGEAQPGTIHRVRITQASHYDLVGELDEMASGTPTPQPQEAPSSPKHSPRKVALRVLPGS